ncbi:hypothetical protein [Peristeroidobacter agariperforans]|uniref:hypothetical protein n=1 Tax=Peristeroidobacter agariperforans TaxID=268404 RepID=UPI001E48AE65|nr:hypothetical protein [Peristeroidobacter agariperforans]
MTPSVPLVGKAMARRNGRRRDPKPRLPVEVHTLDKTRSSVARAVVGCTLLLLMATAAFFAASGDVAELKAVLDQTMPLLAFILGYYFRSPKE